MNSKHVVWILLLLVGNRGAFGQPPGAPRATIPVATVNTGPAITILPAGNGASLQNLGAGSASLDIGRISYFGGSSVSGANSHKTPNSFIVVTRFVLWLDCPGSPPSARAKVSVSRADAGASHSLAIDGVKLGTAAQPLSSMACGSGSEHRLDVEVPISTPAGSIGSTVAFVATLMK
jgi:hypothetical protein